MTNFSDWKRRRGLSDQKIFRVDRCFPDLRRCLSDRGWLANDDLEVSNFWDFRYAIKFKGVGDLSKINDSQVFNFFDRNREFASKSCLTANLASVGVVEPGIDKDSFFPRCFDLSIDSANFTEIFKFTKALSVLKAIAYYGRDAFSPEVVEACLSVAKDFVADADDRIDSHGLHFKFPGPAWEVLEFVNSEDPGNKLKPFDPLSKKSKKSKPPKVAMDPVPEDLEISSLLAAWAEKDFQFSCVTARNPLWILKPAGKSRGRGIRLTTDLAEILEISRKTEQMWVVQKYVENPLIVNGKKFDIRQWSLITQWNPLAVWFYLDCYLRFTLRDYAPENLRDRLAHLTNNSIAKKGQEFENVKEETMMSSAEFDEYMKINFSRNFQEIQAQMKKIVYWTLSSCEGLVGDRRNSFELVGFDFLVDGNFKVWLLEVNCSPDLSYSTATTEKLVKQMFPDFVKVLLDAEKFVIKDERPKRKWGPKLLATIDTGRFTLLKPVTRRREENMHILQGALQLKLQGEKVKISKKRENSEN